MKITHQVYLYLSTVILVLKRLRQSCHQFAGSLDDGVTLCQKTKQQQTMKVKAY